MRYPAFAILLVFAVSLGIAQTPQQTTKKRKPAPTTAQAPEHVAGDPWPIEKLEVDGNKNYTADQVIAASGLRVGQVAGKDQFEAARQRLLDTGAFDRAGYRFAPAEDGKGYNATLEVVEMAQMYPLRFEDLPATDAELREWLKQKDPLFAPKIPATKSELDRYVKLVADFLATRNYHEPLSAKVVSDNPPDLNILIRPAKARPAIVRVKFTDTGVLPSGMLQTAMYGVAVGTPYTEAQLRLLLENTIRPLYEARGMIRVTFPKVETSAAKDVEGVDVTVQVDQGPVYKLEHVNFVGSDITPKQLTRMANLKLDQTANFDEVKDATEKIDQHLRHNGYLQERVEVKRSVNDAAHTVDVTFVLTPGPLFTFHELKIVGLDIETEPAIRKMWGIAPGKPFSVDYPDHFLQRIKEMDLLENLKSTRQETNVNPKDYTVDVTLYFNK